MQRWLCWTMRRLSKQCVTCKVCASTRGLRTILRARSCARERMAHMAAEEVLNTLICVVAGFASGSVLYSAYIPKLFKGVDVTHVSADKNPGAYNAFLYGGVPVGICCLVLDILKGYLPVLLASRVVSPDSPAFAAVMLAPVAGHVFSPLKRFRGGKGIAASFGVLLALVPGQLVVFVLAAAYLITLLLPLHINERRTIAAFSAFALAAILMKNTLSIKVGCALIALLVGFRNWRDAKIPLFSRDQNKTEQMEHLSE
ncbi:MAG: hypothetical protein C0413_04220 [Clostridiales bacterium]|nr:hypothetical protein [Clostridiales bacterium]